MRAPEGRLDHDGGMRVILWLGAIGPTVLLTLLLVLALPKMRPLSAESGNLDVAVEGKQFWWRVRYQPAGGTSVETANEIRVPTGRTVSFALDSPDVIHSFWVPSLAGKQDLIPGRMNDITIVPKRIGIYRGQCAEFCGAQHAHMALTVDVESYADFIEWWDRQLQPARPPANPQAIVGYAYVTSGPCSSCHTIAGTPANGRVGPDLTHLASRRSLAAGTRPMSTGNLYGWIADPQSLKPGNHMPTIGLEPDQLHSVVAYLETLK